MKIYSQIIITLIIIFFLHEMLKEKNKQDIIGNIVTILLFVPIWIYLLGN